MWLGGGAACTSARVHPLFALALFRTPNRPPSTGAKKADIRKVSDTEVEVRARKGAIYTVTFEATDPSGNTTTEAVTIRV